MTPPMQVIIADSARNCIMMEPVLAPRALRIPISRVRSVTETSMIFMTPIPPTSRAMAATRAIKAVIISSTLVIWAIWASASCRKYMSFPWA